MPRDSRMSRMLHVLIHMEQHAGRLTSKDISKMVGTNPVVVRRMMAGLRDRGVVSSEKGHGGGWQLNTSLDAVTLLDVYTAIGEPSLFNMGPHAEHPECLVEQVVDARMDSVLGEAETLLRKRFEAIKVADIATDFAHRLKTHQEQGKTPSKCHPGSLSS